MSAGRIVDALGVLVFATFGGFLLFYVVGLLLVVMGAL